MSEQGKDEAPAHEGRPRSETAAERRRRRAAFLRELTEARELRARVQPRRTKAARMRQAVRMRTFRV
ncbi:hypothetical protein GXW82_31615 [Streptacidiphilus sp. 4-A2]|nr:hypothetical protein [Streptacidiphilus sp. 4-A2]